MKLVPRERTLLQCSIGRPAIARGQCGGGRDEEDRRRLQEELLRLVTEDGPKGVQG
jgi:hypothetical protein